MARITWDGNGRGRTVIRLNASKKSNFSDAVESPWTLVSRTPSPPDPSPTSPPPPRASGPLFEGLGFHRIDEGDALALGAGQGGLGGELEGRGLVRVADEGQRQVRRAALEPLEDAHVLAQERPPRGRQEGGSRVSRRSLHSIRLRSTTWPSRAGVMIVGLPSSKPVAVTRLRPSCQPGLRRLQYRPGLRARRVEDVPARARPHVPGRSSSGRGRRAAGARLAASPARKAR